jgi:6-phosphogluconolactonase (cycloisomerase 2 family)
MIVPNMGSDNIVVFRINQLSGLLRAVDGQVQVSAPTTCIAAT